MPVGKTKDAGWQIGVSRTIERPVDEVWDLLSSPEGLATWLGEGVTLNGPTGQRYETDDGTVGEVRSYRPNDRIRLTWQPVDWDHETTVQVAVTANGDRTVLRFHQERMTGADEREGQRAHWASVLDKMVDVLGGAGT